jgi:hypothetical protein
MALLLASMLLFFTLLNRDNICFSCTSSIISGKRPVEIFLMFLEVFYKIFLPCQNLESALSGTLPKGI